MPPAPGQKYDILKLNCKFENRVDNKYWERLELAPLGNKYKGRIIPIPE